MSVKMNGRHLAKFVADDEFDAIFPQVSLAHETLHGKTGPGSDFLGWVDLPVDYDKEEFARIKKAAAKIQSDSDVLVVIGIGGSYLGARAAIEALKGTLYNNTCKGTPQIFYVGNSISPAYLQSVLDACEGKDISVNVISKSGTTTEPALAFRIFKALLEKKYGKDGAKGRIYATTDKARGTLKELSADEGYETFVVPDDVGGRYSVLTAVGLLPIAAAGCDIDALMAGAAKAREELAVCSTQNECYRYAAARNILYRKGKSVELMACYEPNFTMMNEWYKQLFGESEGKDQKGLMPTSCIFSTDLHSMGQFIQEGSRTMFETIVDVKKPAQEEYTEGKRDDQDAAQQPHHAGDELGQDELRRGDRQGVHQITLASQQVAGEPLDDGECSDDCNGDTQHQVNDRDDGEGKIRSQRRKAEERPQQCGSSQNGQIQSAVNAAGGLELIF